MIKFIGKKEGGMDKLKGKKIVLLYHDSAYGKEPHPGARGRGGQATASSSRMIAVPHPGNEQQSQWLQIRQIKPDWVILWGWGVMNPTALKAAQKVGFPRDKIIGVWWAGAEEDTDSAGDAAKAITRPASTSRARTSRWCRTSRSTSTRKGKGGDPEARRHASTTTAASCAAMFTVEAIRTAQEQVRQEADDRRADRAGASRT